tara:strand:- start:454 stop:813 length:360 start_codon:yes stop_codon:yes gene_type:complete
MAKIKGLRKYYGQEAGNLLLGQLGFDIIADGVTVQCHDSTTGGTFVDKVGQWVSILSVNNGGGVTTLAKAFHGDSFSTTGAEGGSGVALTDGLAISGSFKEITNSASDGDNGILLAYRG